MIGYLNGEIVFQKNGLVIININGVGYKVFIPKPKIKLSNVKLFIHQHIKEDADDLYGFETTQELDFFELLLSVPGVGPKMAMNILRSGNVSAIKNAIAVSDPSSLTAISGVGQKLANKIIIELKAKISNTSAVDIAKLDAPSGELADALDALGLTQREIASIVPKIPDNARTTQEKISWALKYLTTRTG